MKELLSEEHYSYKIRTPFMNTPPFLYGLPPSMDLWGGIPSKGFFQKSQLPYKQGVFFFQKSQRPYKQGGFTL